MNSEAIHNTHSFVSVKGRALFLKSVDLIYNINLIWVSWFVFMLFFIAYPKEITESGLSVNFLNAEKLIDIFLLFWFVRYWFRRRGTPLDFILAILPIQVIFFVLNISSASSGIFYFINGLMFVLLLLTTYLLLKNKWLSRNNINFKSIFSILSGILNPFLFLAFPFYIAILLLTLGIINAALSNQYYGGLFFLLLIPYLLKPIKKLANPSARLLLKIDRRPCVLYLRSFSLDSEIIGNSEKYSVLPKKSIEEILSRTTSKIGPFIAIADPKSKLQSIGAAKTKFGDHEWQSVVHDYTLKSKFIVMLAGDTTAIDWELSKIKSDNKDMDLLILFGRPVINKLQYIMSDPDIDLSSISDRIGEDIIGAFKKDNDTLVFLSGNPREKYSYEAAFQFFLRERQY